MAQEMGARLGQCQILFREVQTQQIRRIVSAFVPIGILRAKGGGGAPHRLGYGHESRFLAALA